MYTGLTGALKIINALGGETTIAYISDWSVEGKTEMIERTRVGQTNRQVVPGFQSWSASASGTISFDGAGGHDDLFAAQYNGTKILFHFYLKDGKLSGGSGKNTYLCGEGYIESLSMDLSAEDCGSVSISVAGTGPLELYVDDINVVTSEEHILKDTLKMKIENGHLYADVPDDMAQSVWIDDAGHLVVKL